MAQAKHTASQKRKKRRLVTVATVVVIAAAVLVFLFRDELFSGKASRGESVGSGEPFTYENGSDQSFALADGALAISSSTGAQLLDKSGLTAARQVFSMSEPCVCAGGKNCIFYDVGGTAVRAYINGKYTELDGEYAVIAVSINSAGWFAVCTEESGYKGSVTVFNAEGEQVYKWYSGTDYLLDAAVSPDSTRLITLCAGEAGSSVRFFRLSEEEEYAKKTIASELCYELSVMESGSACVLSDTAMHFFDKNGNEDKSFSFGDSYLVDYELSESFCCVVTSLYVSGSEVTLTSFSSGGKQLGSASLAYPPESLSSRDSKLLMFGTGGIRLYDKDMDEIKSAEAVPGYKSALLMPDGKALLLAAYHAEKIALK